MLVPVHAGERRGSEGIASGPEQGLGRKHHDVVRGFHALREVFHIEVGHDAAEEVDAVIKRHGHHDFGTFGRLLHVAAQGAGALFLVLVKDGVEVELFRGFARHGLLAENGAVGLDAGETVNPGNFLEEVVHPRARRRLVRVGHEALQPVKLGVNAHHTLREDLVALGELTLIIVVDGGRLADVFVPEALRSFPHVLDGLIPGTSGSHDQSGHKAGNAQPLFEMYWQNQAPLAAGPCVTASGKGINQADHFRVWVVFRFRRHSLIVLGLAAGL